MKGASMEPLSKSPGAAVRRSQSSATRLKWNPSRLKARRRALWPSAQRTA